MKRKFLNFPARSVSYLPKIQSRRQRIGTSRHNIAYKTDAPPADELTEAEAIAAIGKQVDGFQVMLGEKADKAEIDTLKAVINDLQANIGKMESDKINQALKTINDGNESLHRQIIEIQEKQAANKEGGTGASAGPRITTKQVQDFIKATFEDGRKTNNKAEIEIETAKAAEIFSTATFYMGGAGTDISAVTGRVVDPELHFRKRKTNIVLDYFNIQGIGVPTIVYLIKVEDGTDPDSLSGDSGGAAWITCGEQKPMRSFRVTTGTATAKKVAIFGTVEDCLLQDVPSLERWIREDFMAEMREEINNGLLNNNPAVDPDAPLGIKQNATQYIVTPGYNNKFTANTTNYIDQLIAVFAMMRYRKEEAGVAFVSSDVWYQILHLKDTQQRYQNQNLVYTSNTGRIYIAGVEVVAVDEEDVPSTHVLVIAKELGFKIYAYGSMVFERGLNGEDFRYDRTSFRGYQRFLSFIPENRENSVVYDTWANIKAAIEA